MDILIIDRESLTSQLISSKLTAKGHRVVAEPAKAAALEKIKTEHFDCVIVDPAPLSEAKPVVIGIWKNLPAGTPRPHLLLLSKTATPEEAIMSGADDVLIKPFSSLDIDNKLGNAERLVEIVRRLSRTEDVTHSAAGIIGRTAFNQLILSCIDRAFRYGEKSLVVFIEIVNAETPPDMIRQLVEKMTFMRRQSDVIGHIDAREFGILLQRPQYESEPLDALERFCEVLEKFCAGFVEAEMPKLTLKLIELPQGRLVDARAIPARLKIKEDARV